MRNKNFNPTPTTSFTLIMLPSQTIIQHIELVHFLQSFMHFSLCLDYRFRVKKNENEKVKGFNGLKMGIGSFNFFIYFSFFLIIKIFHPNTTFKILIISSKHLQSWRNFKKYYCQIIWMELVILFCYDILFPFYIVDPFLFF